MTTPIVKIHNLETGEELERPMTAEELVQWEADIAASVAREQAKAEQEAAKEAAKTAAETKLAALGLTTDDLKALGLGGN